jgi:hypothetical protein
VPEWKVSEMIHILNEVFMEVYYPHQEISFDESSVQCEGRAFGTVSMKHKYGAAGKFGYMLYSQCCAKNHYLLNTRVASKHTRIRVVNQAREVHNVCIVCY